MLSEDSNDLNLVIRNINRDELKRFIDQFVEIYFSGYKGFEIYAYQTPERVKKYINWLYRQDPKGFFVAFVNHYPVGFIGGHKDWFFAGKVFGEIHEIVVRPEFKSMGIASKLLKKVLDYFKESGKTKAGLWVGVTNEPAKKFYLKHGFEYRGTFGKWERWEKKLF
ncbi:MAG: GNAT family N-acetyltransferase [Actinobacteria bacterium]|nr:GNAT family N-acetyltransferase [Actinomycetota bacterium]